MLVSYALKLHTLKPTIPLSTEITGIQLKNKETPITLRQALDSYNERVEFVKHSSSACVVSSCELLLCFETVELFYLEAVLLKLINNSSSYSRTK